MRNHKTIFEMTAEIREVNTALGWHTGTNTLGELVALMHTEVAEALEAYRDHRLADATRRLCEARRVHDPEGDHAHQCKPEGVGSELADLVIRLLSTCDLTGVPAFDSGTNLADIPPGGPLLSEAPQLLETFGDWAAWLHRCVDRFWDSKDGAAVLRAVVIVAVRFGVNLTGEYERKIAYNRTRPYQHGGRTLVDDVPR